MAGWVDTLKGVVDVLDELCAAALIVSGIAYIFQTQDFQAGLAITNIGGGYLFGKSIPKK